MSSFGEQLNGFRQAKNLNIQRLAQAADLSSSYVSLLIRGQKKAPSAETVAALADALDLTPAERSQLFLAADIVDLPSEELGVSGKVTSDGSGKFIPALDAGILEVYPYLVDLLLDERILHAQQIIRIQEIWLPDPGSYRSAFADAFARNPALQIEILLLSPSSPYAKARACDLQARTEGYVSEQIQDAIHEFGQLQKQGAALTVRTYDALPSLQQIRCDERILVGFYAHGERSDLAPQLDVLADSPFGRFLQAEFDRLWQQGQVVTPPTN